MKRFITLITLLFVAVCLFSQRTADRFMTLGCSISQSGSSSGKPHVSCNCVDQGGTYDASNVQVGDSLMFVDSGVGYKLPVDSIVTPGTPTVVVRVDWTGLGLVMIPTGSGALSRGASNGIDTDVAGLSDGDAQVWKEDNVANFDFNNNRTYVTSDSFTTFVPSTPTPQEGDLVLSLPKGNWYQKVSGNWVRKSLENGTTAASIYSAGSVDTLTWNANLYRHVRVNAGTRTTVHIDFPTNMATQFVGSTYLVGVQNGANALTVTWDTLYGKFDYTDMPDQTLSANSTINYQFRVVADGSEGVRLQWVDGGQGGVGVTDGDKGDIDVTDSGTVWTIDTSAVEWMNLSNAVQDSISAWAETDWVASSDFTAKGDVLVGTGSGTYTARKNNDAATTAPTATDDSAAGYSVGSTWTDVTNDKVYWCADATAAAAVWKDLTSYPATATATSTINQAGSESLKFQSSSWTGSSEVKNDFIIRADSSNTQNNFPRFLGLLDGIRFLRVDKSSFSASYNGIGLTTLGYYAGNSNTTGYNNTFYGGHSGEDNTVGSQNTFTGNRSGKKNTTGSQNTFTGQGAGYENTTGLGNSYYSWHSGLNVNADYNSFYGWQTGQGAIGSTGGANSFFGSSIAPNYTTATRNSALGRNSMNALTTGVDNTSVGFGAGFSNTTGNYNTYIGLFAGYTGTPANANVSGNYNTYIGYQAGPGTSTQLTNAMAIGNNALVSTDNAAVFGNATTRIRVGLNVASPESMLHVQKGIFGGTYRSDEVLMVEAGNENNYIGLTSADGYSTGIHMGSASDNLRAYISLSSSTDVLTLGSHTTNGQVAIVAGNGIERVRIDPVGRMGLNTTTPDPSSILDLTTTSRGFLLPRMTATQRNGISSPATGLQVYNTSLNKLNYYNGSAWVAVMDSTNADNNYWKLGGNTTGATAAIGTIDNQTFNIHTQGTNRLSFSGTGGLTSGTLTDIQLTASDSVTLNASGSGFSMNGSFTRLYDGSNILFQVNNSTQAVAFNTASNNTSSFVATVQGGSTYLQHNSTTGSEVTTIGSGSNGSSTKLISDYNGIGKDVVPSAPFNLGADRSGGAIPLGGTVAGWKAEFDANNFTDTLTSASGSAVGVVSVNIEPDTINVDSSNVTHVNAYTMRIGGPPVAGTGTGFSITNPGALWVDAGKSRFDDQILGSATTFPQYSFNGDTDSGFGVESSLLKLVYNDSDAIRINNFGEVGINANPVSTWALNVSATNGTGDGALKVTGNHLYTLLDNEGPAFDINYFDATGTGLAQDVFKVNTSNGSERVIIGEDGGVMKTLIHQELDKVSSEVTTTTTATLGEILLVDCSGGTVEVDVPTTGLSAGDWFAVSDTRGNAASNNITIDFGGASVPLHATSGDPAADYIINSNQGFARFTYVDATVGWIITGKN